MRIIKVIYNNWLAYNKDLKVLQIDVTSKCNLSCLGCYHKTDMKNKDKDINFWRELTSEYSKKGFKNFWIFGGEPTLTPEIFDIAQKSFPLIYVITNGVIKIPKKYNFRIFVSLDGLKDTNDLIRGKGTFDKVVNNYRGDKRVVVNMAISKKNINEISPLIEFVKKDMKVHGICFQFYSPRPDATQEEINNLLLQKEDIKKLKKVFEKYEFDKKVFMTNLLLDTFADKKVNYENCSYRFYVDSYYSDGRKKKCCNAGTDCELCRIVPPYFCYVNDNYKDVLTYYKFLNWL